MALPKGQHNSGIKNLVKLKKGEALWKFEEKQYICTICGNNYTSTAPYTKYCSVKCREKARHSITGIDYTCQTCGEKFKRRKLQKTKNFGVNRFRYCSKECEAVEKMINGVSNYMYKAFLLKDEIKCERCGQDDYMMLVVHHKDRDRKNSKIDNLEILCANCHTKEHYIEMKTRTQKIERIKELKEKGIINKIKKGNL